MRKKYVISSQSNIRVKERKKEGKYFFFSGKNRVLDLHSSDFLAPKKWVRILNKSENENSKR